ncbi:chemotaxis protein CheW [Duganella radicis]|uniref:Chemotaxis protein CheW n=1 Tax=Duganella radicis TaxID=551988 RepID=A0A6L6PM80_9BURK|nr:chemotaxis protein CheW [Duganella radicis]MTV40063.1 chemotaxis protein CheW [Duganella radicis]
MSGPAPTERRSRLRQYQVQLLERMQAAKTGATDSGRELGVSIGGRLCLLDLTQISEIVPLQAATPVPLTQDWYLGLTNIRGNLTGVIDLARYRRYGGGGASPAERRLISFAPGLGFNCALLVERVLGLRKLADMEAVAGDEFRDSEGQSWLRIDLAQLVREPRFVQVGLV